MTRNPWVFGAAVVIGAAALLFGLVLPRGREVADLQAALRSERAEVARLSTRVDDLRAADPVILRSIASDYRALVPDSSDLSGFLATLDRLALASGVVVSNVSVGTPAPANSAPVTAIGFTISAAGDYFGLSRFLFELEHAPRLLRVGTLGLSGSGGNLQLTITVEAYTTDASTGPGSDPSEGAVVGA